MMLRKKRVLREGGEGRGEGVRLFFIFVIANCVLLFFFNVLFHVSRGMDGWVEAKEWLLSMWWCEYFLSV